MGIEIERKFTIKEEFIETIINKATKSSTIKQGYISSSPDRSVRVRISNLDAFLTIKGRTKGIRRSEFEYPIPLKDASSLLKLAEGPIIHKVRYIIEENNNSWEVDIFEGDNRGLNIAEIELESETQKIILPKWINREVTGDNRYYNLALCSYPYNQWDKIDN